MRVKGRVVLLGLICQLLAGLPAQAVPAVESPAPGTNGTDFGDAIATSQAQPFEVEGTSTPQVASTETSYKNFKEAGLVPQVLPSLPGGQKIGDARAYGRFSPSGQLDLFTATQTYSKQNPPGAATPAIFRFWLRQPNGTFVQDTQLLGSPDGCVHPRKAIVADFNGDGRPDVFVACHGFDAEPFPGEKNKIVLSQPNGTYVTTDASADVGFFHSASAADLNGDGLPDVVVVGNYDPEGVIVLLNQGGGVFQREPTSRLPSSIPCNGCGRFTVELVDVDGNGTTDLLLGGHEWEGTETVVLLNPGSSNFKSVVPITIPAVPNEGVVLDFAVTGTASIRTLWVLRTSGGDGTFYQSRTIQKVNWSDLASSVPLLQRPAKWFPWIIPTTVNGEDVIASDNASDNVAVPQPRSADRIFNCVENMFPQVFAPAGSASQSAYGYYFRYYDQTNSYVGTQGGTLYYYAPNVNPNLNAVGPESTYLNVAAQAGC